MPIHTVSDARANLYHDARELATGGLKENAQALLDILAVDPLQSPPPFEDLVGDLNGAYSRRINIGE